MRNHIKAKRVQGEELENLTKQYLENPTKELRDQIIMGLVQPVQTIARSFRMEYDDFIAEALYELVAAVDRFPNIAEDSNIQAYVFSCIRYKLRDCMKRFWAIPIAARTVRHKKSQGEELPVVVLVPAEWAKVEDKDFHIILDILTQILTNTMDNQIFQLHAEGYKNNEIARIIGKSPSFVSFRLNKIKTSFMEKWRGK